MLKPILTIDDFKAGIQINDSLPIKGGFSYGEGVDIYMNPGYIQASQQTSAMSSDSGELDKYIYSLIKFSIDGNYYGMCSGTVISATTSGNWGTAYRGFNASGISPQSPNIVCEFNDHLYFNNGWNQIGWMTASPVQWGASVGTDVSIDYSTLTYKLSPMQAFGNKLYIGNGSYVYSISTTGAHGTADNSALDIPAGYEITSLAVYGNRLIIGAAHPTHSKAKIFTWDGSSASFEEDLELQEDGVWALMPWNNYLLVFAGKLGNIYLYNGASIKKATKIPYMHVAPTVNKSVVKHQSIANVGGNVYFGLSAATNDIKNGIWCLGQAGMDSPMSLTLKHIPSGVDANHTQINAIAAIDEDEWIYSWEHATASDYGIQKVNANKFSNAYWESQIYDVSYGKDRRIIKGIEIGAKLMGAGEHLTLQYKINRESSWNTLVSASSSNQYDMFPLNKEAKEIQLRVNFGVSGANSPQLCRLKIY